MLRPRWQPATLPLVFIAFMKSFLTDAEESFNILERRAGEFGTARLSPLKHNNTGGLDGWR